MTVQIDSRLPSSNNTTPLNPPSPETIDLTPYLKTYVSYFMDENPNISKGDRLIAGLFAVPAAALFAATATAAFLLPVACAGSGPTFEGGDCREAGNCPGVEGESEAEAESEVEAEGEAEAEAEAEAEGEGEEAGIWEDIAAGAGEACAGRYDHSTIWTGDWMIVWGGTTTEGLTNTGCAYRPESKEWIPLPSVSLEGRKGHCAVWTGAEMFVWGGLDDSAGGIPDYIYYGSGAKFTPGAKGNPRTGCWSLATATGAPSERSGHICAWDRDDAVVIWGGEGPGRQRLATGARYFPGMDSWSGTQPTEAPLAGVLCSANTGAELLVWGWNNDSEPRGYIYSYSGDNSWQPFCDSPLCRNSDLPWQQRDGAACSWSGSEMIIWGGVEVGGGPLPIGSRYNRDADSWTAMTEMNSPSGRRVRQSAWVDCRPGLETGAMVVWGGDLGLGDDDQLSSGGVYQPDLDRWTPTSTEGEPATREGPFSMVSTDDSVIIWGGDGGRGALRSDGAIYRPCGSDIVLE